MFKGQIGHCGPEQYEREKGKLYTQLTEAIKLLEEAQYQPSHDTWNQMEEDYLDECKNAQKQLEKIMMNMFFALTGKRIKVSKKKK